MNGTRVFYNGRKDSKQPFFVIRGSEGYFMDSYGAMIPFCNAADEYIPFLERRELELNVADLSPVMQKSLEGL